MKDIENLKDFVANKIYPAATEVSNLLGPWWYEQEENYHTNALAYQFRSDDIKMDREVAVTQYYKNTVLSTAPKEVDFLIYPNQNNVNLTSAIFLEAKHNPSVLIHDKAEARFQLFRNIYSAQFSNNDLFNSISCGICLWWGSNSIKKDTNMNTIDIEEFTFTGYSFPQLELWISSNNDKTEFKRVLYLTDNNKIKYSNDQINISKNTKNSISEFTLHQLKIIAKKYDIAFKSNVKKQILETMIIAYVEENNLNINELLD